VPGISPRALLGIEVILRYRTPLTIVEELAELLDAEGIVLLVCTRVASHGASYGASLLISTFLALLRRMQARVLVHCLKISHN